MAERGKDAVGEDMGEEGREGMEGGREGEIGPFPGRIRRKKHLVALTAAVIDGR